MFALDGVLVDECHNVALRSRPRSEGYGWPDGPILLSGLAADVDLESFYVHESSWEFSRSTTLICRFRLNIDIVHIYETSFPYKCIDLIDVLICSAFSQHGFVAVDASFSFASAVAFAV